MADPVFDLIGGLLNKIFPDPVERAKAEAQLAEAQAASEKIKADELATINQTMQAESKSEHWAVWGWRPMIGFTFAFTIVWNYILTPLLQTWFSLKSVIIPDQIWNAMLVILGAASATRGWQLANQASRQNGNGGNGNPAASKPADGGSTPPFRASPGPGGRGDRGE